MILALHGNLGSASDWERLDIPDLEAIDLWDFSQLSFEEFAAEILETNEKPILAGYSLGGRLALHAMALYPERWSGAVILSAHPGLPCVEDRIARRSSDAVWANRARELEWIDFLKKWDEQPVLGDFSRGHERLSLESRREDVAQAFENWSLGRQDDLRSRLKAFPNPVLWITGERDDKFSAIGSSMVEVFSNFRHEILTDCGHRVLMEKPDRVGDQIVDFVRTARTGE